MNLGNKINELRRSKNITQDALAAELGVTAAAVSKWENGYTLPDVLMLCALADYFEVTTDELLGRNTKYRYAVIAVSSPELGRAITDLVKRYGFIVKHTCSSYADALEIGKSDDSVTHLFVSFADPLSEEEKGDTTYGLCSIEVSCPNQQQVLDGFELYLQNQSHFDVITQKAKT